MSHVASPLVWLGFPAVDLYSYIAASRMSSVCTFCVGICCFFFMKSCLTQTSKNTLRKHITKVFLSICYSDICVCRRCFFFKCILVPANIVIKCIARANGAPQQQQHCPMSIHMRGFRVYTYIHRVCELWGLEKLMCLLWRCLSMWLI